MRKTTTTVDDLVYTVWGGGTVVSLACAGRSVCWQGEEAAEIVDRLDAADNFASELGQVWDEYECIAEEN